MPTVPITMDQGFPFAGWRDPATPGEQVDRNDRCRNYLERLRWPNGPHCPRCESSGVARVPSRHQIDCRSCRYRFSVTSGTLLQNSNVPLWKWLLAVSLLVDADSGFPAHRLAPAIGVSYKTAWSVGHRIRAAMGGSSEAEGHALETLAASRASRTPRLYDPAVAGSYHQVSVKYLPSYLAEREWRARNQANPNAFRDAVLALLHAAPAAGPGTARAG
jgi:transposase-like protein